MTQHDDGRYDLARAAKERTVLAMRKLAEVMEDPEQSGSARLWATSLLLARGWGGSVAEPKPAAPGSCEAEARRFAPKILDALDQLMSDKRQPAQVVLWAAQIVLECAFGPARKLKGAAGLKAPQPPARGPGYRHGLMGGAAALG